MDSCKKFKDLILTDYIDGELDEELKERVDAHLFSCLGCRSFAGEVEKNLIVPFNKAHREIVPEQVWLSIQEKLMQEELFCDNAGSFISKLFCYAKLIELSVLLPRPTRHENRGRRSNILEQNNSSEAKEPVLLLLRRRIIESFSFPKLISTLGMLVLSVLVVSAVFYNQQIKQAREKEQSEYLVSLLDATEDSPETDNSGQETPLEKYFL